MGRGGGATEIYKKDRTAALSIINNKITNKKRLDRTARRTLGCYNTILHVGCLPLVFVLDWIVVASMLFMYKGELSASIKIIITPLCVSTLMRASFPSTTLLKGRYTHNLLQDCPSSHHISHTSGCINNSSFLLLKCVTLIPFDTACTSTSIIYYFNYHSNASSIVLRAVTVY
jgi:hypothetical protein